MAKLVDAVGRPHSGVLPFVVPALVTDNKDPDELARVQVKFPTLHQEPLSFWLRQCRPNAGKERGLYSTPEVDDEVLVCFMQGSHDVGIILGQMWNGVDKPPTEAKDGMPTSGDADIGGNISTAKHADGSTSLDTNDRRFWRSRSGHLVVLDDTDGSETLQLWDKSHVLSLVFDTAGTNIILANTKGDIHIRTKTDLYLEAGNDIKYYAKNNIEGEAGMDIKIKAGMNYEFESGMDAKHKAGMNYKIEASINFEAKGSVAAKIEGSVQFEGKGGATAKLEGSGMCQVKGGIVMIN